MQKQAPKASTINEISSISAVVAPKLMEPPVISSAHTAGSSSLLSVNFSVALPWGDEVGFDSCALGGSGWVEKPDEPLLQNSPPNLVEIADPEDSMMMQSSIPSDPYL